LLWLFGPLLNPFINFALIGLAYGLPNLLKLTNMTEVLLAALPIIIIVSVLFVYFQRQFKRLQQQQKDQQEPVIKMVTDWNQQTFSQLTQLRQEMQNRLDQSAKALNEQTGVINQQMLVSNKTISERLDKASEVIGGVQKHLGQLSEVSGYIKDLHDTLQAPKLRGNIGEQILTDLIKQHIPQEKFILQHSFKDGLTVDAAIQTAEGIIPVDSKFPMEAFRRYQQSQNEQDRLAAGKEFANAVRKHIRDITGKYIKPDEGTVDFAVMYIPSEPIAYEILVNFPELVEYAQESRITITSPNQFNAFLRVVLIGMEKQQVGQQIKVVLQTLKTIQQEAGKIEETLLLTNKHLTNAKRSSDDALTGFTRLRGKIDNYQVEQPKQATLLD